MEEARGGDEKAVDGPRLEASSTLMYAVASRVLSKAAFARSASGSMTAETSAPLIVCVSRLM